MSLNHPFPDTVRIIEVGARDGLQNTTKHVSPAVRAQLVNLLVDSGLTHIDTSSFVSPKRVPQMANADQVFANLNRKQNVVYSALTPNLKGMEMALAAGATEAAIFTSASEGFCQSNINCSIAESLKRFESVMELAQQHNIPVRGYVSCIDCCPYDGQTSPEQVASISHELYQMGCHEVSLGDTIGTGTPIRIKRVLEATSKRIPMAKLAAHYHDTYGQALANILASLEEGLAIIDSSVAGLGGCPYAPGASGNVATEDVVYMLQGMGIETGVNMDRLLIAANFICHELGIESRSAAGTALSLRNSFLKTATNNN
ncbi:hydroxymethylglutaryl-CoA lyase [Endozoicomonas sp. OPT23]|uniref:hydroxymethylglutaryl-CoA lyase n=1 Tax=Endozoicomonas sp. OPT23 TaxID=2072845 RepID=UPI00129BCCFA|nr:hydroxymethylglutaryl-CoA lyase [Endozoicomonas sp. OPT23]MRI34055.1 hydroxymethylglutaryl-CoA lyase [Endozoicomonas sp. OPT23]